MYFEKQYSALDDANDKYGYASFGSMSSFTWNNDPKRLVFLLSRYKFVSKMFHDFPSVLEVGCADAFASRIVSQSVGELTVTDIDKKLLDEANRLGRTGPYPFNSFWHDILESKMTGSFDGIYLLDVLEHISVDDEKTFISNILPSLNFDGQMIIGIPSLESQKYASQESKEGHVNCKSSSQLRNTLKEYFHNVNIFSMNDEVVHTGFESMSHYLMALCSYKKDIG